MLFERPDRQQYHRAGLDPGPDLGAGQKAEPVPAAGIGRLAHRPQLRRAGPRVPWNGFQSYPNYGALVASRQMEPFPARLRGEPVLWPACARRSDPPARCPTGRSRRALRDGSLLAVSGQVSVDEAWQTVGVGDFALQARQVFENIRVVLEAAGADFSHVAELTYYLVDLDDFPVLDQVRRDFLVAPYPASTAVEVPRLLNREWLLEVSAIAILPA